MTSARPRPPMPVRPQRPGPRTAAALPALALVLVLVVLTSVGCSDPETTDPAGPAGSGPAASSSPRSSPRDPGGRLGRSLLPAADLPAADLAGGGEDGGWRAASGSGGSPRWPWAQDDCPGYRDADYPAQAHRYAAIQRAYAGPAAPALQVVEAYQSGWGTRAMDDARRVLRACPSYPFLGGKVIFTVLDPPAVAGDDTLVVRGKIKHSGTPPTVSYFVTVRLGDTVSTLNLPDPGDEARVFAVARKLAARLA